MCTWKRIAVYIVALLALSLLTGTGTALAAGLSVDPTYGNYGTTYTVSGSGFNAHERVSIWVTLSDGKTVALPQITADDAGMIEFDITPTATWASDEVIAVAHGLSSGREYSVKFHIVAPADQDEEETVDSGAWLGNPNGLTLIYRGSGYTQGERVATWYQNPTQLATQTATALSDVMADETGNVKFEFVVNSNWQYGGYQITARGKTSQHTTYNTFSFFGTITDHRTYWVGAQNIALTTWTGEYFNNPYLWGTPVLVRTDSGVNFDWGTGSPAPSIAPEYFSVRWTGTAYVPSAHDYTITATADDGMRVWVDGNLVIDEWQAQTATTYSTTIHLHAGSHSLKVEYFEWTGDAVAIVEIVRD